MNIVTIIISALYEAVTGYSIASGASHKDDGVVRVEYVVSVDGAHQAHEIGQAVLALWNAITLLTSKTSIYLSVAGELANGLLHCYASYEDYDRNLKSIRMLGSIVRKANALLEGGTAADAKKVVDAAFGNVSATLAMDMDARRISTLYRAVIDAAPQEPGQDPAGNLDGAILD